MNKISDCQSKVPAPASNFVNSSHAISIKFPTKNDTGIIKFVFKTKNRHIKHSRVEQIAQVNFTVGEQKEPTVYLLIMKFQVRDASTPPTAAAPLFLFFFGCGTIRNIQIVCVVAAVGSKMDGVMLEGRLLFYFQG